jgi:hypothetical protein
MRTLFVTMAIVLSAGPDASGQAAPRFGVGPVVRADKVMVESGLDAVVPVFGLTASARLSKTWGVEGEITGASGDFSRSYEGWFVSYAPPNSTRAEIERLAPTARRTMAYLPGLGGSVAVTARGGSRGRAGVVVRLGMAFRRYTETSDFTILTIPEGIDPVRVAASFGSERTGRSRGGLLAGVEAPIRLAGQLTVSPEVRYVYGGPARVGEKHREVSLGIRAGWGF